MKAGLPGLLVVSLGVSACDDAADEEDVARGSSRIVTATEVVSDRPGAQSTDPTLVNAWGLAFNPSGVAWVSATERGVARIYDADGSPTRDSVEISAAGGAPAAPTGQVFNEDRDAFAGDLFVFVTEDGVISGWQQTMGGQAVQRVDNSSRGSVYKGVAIARDAEAAPHLFVADFGNAAIDVFDAEYRQLSAQGFADPELPPGFAPFNVEAVGDLLLVAYALQDEQRSDDVAGEGNGFVNLFASDGSLRARLIAGGELNSPWGMAVAPADFRAAPNRLLVGNFGDGRIHVFRLDLAADPPSALAEGPLLSESGSELTIDGLWALEFAPAAGGFDSTELWYTAGPDGESHGVLGRIESSPQASGVPGEGVAGPSPRPVTPY